MRNATLTVELAEESAIVADLLAKESCRLHTKHVEMFRRKLTALDYHNPNGFDCTGKKNTLRSSVELNVEPANVRKTTQRQTTLKNSSFVVF